MTTNVARRNPDDAANQTAATRCRREVGRAASDAAKHASGYLWRSRLRMQAVPWAAAGGTYLAAAAADAAGPPALAAGVAAAGIGGLAGRWRAHRRRKIRPAYPVAAAGASAGWQLAAAAAGGPTGPLVGALVAGTAVLGLPWWRHHGPQFPDLEAERLAQLTPAPQPQAELEPQRDDPPWQIVLYNEHLAAKGPLAGTWITDLEAIPYGFAMVVNWPIGRTYDELFADGAKRAIRSVYDVPDTQVSPEILPGRPPRRARLVVLTDDPLRRANIWPGPDVTDGAATIGVYADGQPVPWTFWDGDGAWHGIVSGVSGSGKSKVMTMLGVTALCSDRMVPWLLDGQAGASSPELIHRVDRAGHGPADSLQRLRELQAVMDDRSARMPHMTWTDAKGRTRRGVSKIVPTPQLPLVLVIIDEAQKVLENDQAVTIVKEIAATGRKVAVSLVLFTQVPSAGNLNTITGLREQLKAFNVLILRLEEHFTTGMISSDEFPVPPHKLPKTFDDGSKTSGLGYKADDRRVMMRTLLIPDGTEDHAGDAFDELDWIERGVTTSLEPQAVNALQCIAGRGSPKPATHQQVTPTAVINQAAAKLAALHTDN